MKVVSAQFCLSAETFRRCHNREIPARLHHFRAGTWRARPIQKVIGGVSSLRRGSLCARFPDNPRSTGKYSFGSDFGQGRRSRKSKESRALGGGFPAEPNRECSSVIRQRELSHEAEQGPGSLADDGSVCRAQRPAPNQKPGAPTFLQHRLFGDFTWFADAGSRGPIPILKIPALSIGLTLLEPPAGSLTAAQIHEEQSGPDPLIGAKRFNRLPWTPGPVSQYILVFKRDKRPIDDNKS